MRPRTKQWAALLGAVLAISLALGARALFGETRVPERAVIVYDRSDSKRDVCQALAGVAEEALSRHRWGKGSVFSVLATGDASTLGEPIEVYRFSAFRRQRTVEGRASGAKLLKKILDEVIRACQRTPRAGVSPVYLAVRRGAETVAARGCAPHACSLAVVTDGEETAEGWIIAAMKGIESEDSAPAPILNGTISVRLCGLSETSEAAGVPDARALRRARGKRTGLGRSGARADRVEAAWRNVFSVPGAVEVSPLCPKRDAEVAP